MEKKFSHIDENGKARMVDVGGKGTTERTARARCKVKMNPSTLKYITGDKIKKGDVFTVAKIAGITAAKKTGELIPLCHPLLPEHIDVSFRLHHENGVMEIFSTVAVTAKTGAEMEALQAVVQAALTVYDMCKAVDRGMTITDIELVEKKGGSSGQWKRE